MTRVKETNKRECRTLDLATEGAVTKEMKWLQNVERELYGKHLLKGIMHLGGALANSCYVADSEPRRRYLGFTLLLLSDLPAPPIGSQKT